MPSPPADGAAEAGPFSKADPVAARNALGGAPLTVRIGYQGPNARLAVTVGAISQIVRRRRYHRHRRHPGHLGTPGAAGRKDRRAAGQHRRRHRQRIDADRRRWTPTTLHSGNGNNLSGYANPQIDGNIGALAVSADPAERVRLLTESAPVLWGDMPTLPLYRQQRTLLMSKKMYAVSKQSDPLGRGLEHGPMGPDAVRVQ